ncbi:MAG TPA: isoprenylcysteine carboxylmethyltransferase family protein [Planctomycetota bacterium]|nr:isoprenylcysteine carboxylmethyltransferase family protein [Planctomycetota bacterium]
MSPLRRPLEAAGHFLFRTRNALFPAAFLAAALLFPPPTAPRGPAWLAAGLALLAAGQAIRVVTIGLKYVKRGGKDGRIYASGLVTDGVFAHCRNPMYLGNLLALLGLLTLAQNPWAIAVGGGFFLLAYLSITLAEETYLLGRFGDDYRDYCRRVPRFLPRLGGLGTTLRAPFDGRKVVSKEHGTLYLNVMLAAATLAYAAHRAGDLDRWLLPLAAVASAATAGYALARIAKKRTSWLRAKGAR